MRWFSLLLFLPLGVAHYIKGISIYGLETDWRNFVCYWSNDVEYYVQQVKEMGFNTIRVPFSYQYVLENNFERMDHIFQLTYAYNMTIIPDLHRIWNSQQGPDPFDGGVTMDQFIDCWKTVCTRYQNFPNFVGINAYNEYQGNDIAFVNDYSCKLFTAIEEAFPFRFRFWATGTHWAGNLTGINLEHLPFADRVGYSVHKYSWSGTADQADWDWSIPLHLDPEKIVIGEFGWKEEIPEQVEWAKRFIQYLKKRGLRHTIYWTVAHSHDTGNLWEDNCQVIKYPSLQLLQTAWTERRYLRGLSKEQM